MTASNGGHGDVFCERLIQVEKDVALNGLRLEALEKGTHLSTIVNDISEIKEMIKGGANSKGLLAKVDAVEENQQKMVWLLAGFALCVPTAATVFLTVFPKFYDIQFVPHNPKPGLVKPVRSATALHAEF
jgi:hypothetical protein